jgi:hypothetical protein
MNTHAHRYNGVVLNFHLAFLGFVSQLSFPTPVPPHSAGNTSEQNELIMLNTNYLIDESKLKNPYW